MVPATGVQLSLPSIPLRKYLLLIPTWFEGGGSCALILVLLLPISLFYFYSPFEGSSTYRGLDAIPEILEQVDDTLFGQVTAVNTLALYI